MSDSRRFVRRNRVDERNAVAIAVVAGIVAVLSSAEPTGSTVIDWLLIVASVGAVVWASASAPWWAPAAAAGVAAVVSLQPFLTVIGAIAFVGGLVIGIQRRDYAEFRALVTAVALNVLIRSQLDEPFGATAAIGMVVGVVLFVVGVRRRASMIRRVGLITAASVAGIAVLAVGAAALAALSVRSDLSRGIDQARSAVDVLNDGSYEQAAVLFADASNAFEGVDRRLGGPLGLFAQLVPGVSQNVSAGADLAEAAGMALGNVSSALDQVDPDSLRVVDGAIDVEAIRAVEQPLADVQASLAALRDTTEGVRSPWLLGRIQTELDELTTDFDDNEPRLQKAIDAVRLAPQILGADGPRRYLVLFTTPVEARGIAGFPGNYAVIEIADGDIDVAEFGRRSDLDRAAAENEASCLECPPEMRERYGIWGVDAGGGRFGVPGWTGITTAAHFPYVGETAQIIYPQSGGEPIDGVISMDPYVLQALMRYTGPIELSETGVVVEPENAARFLLEDQYLLLEDGANEDRIEALDTLGQQVLEKLLAGALPVPSDLARDLGPLVAEQRLLMWTSNPDEQELIDRVGMSGALPPLGDDGGFVVMVSNGGNSKIDAFLDRTVETTIETRDDGTRVLLADVILTNTAPATGLPQYVIGNSFGFPEGTSWLWVNFFGPDGLLSATADGEPMELETGTEVGWTTYERYEALAAGESVSYRLEFELGPDLDGTENVVRWTQPLARRAP